MSAELDNICASLRQLTRTEFESNYATSRQMGPVADARLELVEWYAGGMLRIGMWITPGESGEETGSEH